MNKCVHCSMVRSGLTEVQQSQSYIHILWDPRVNVPSPSFKLQLIMKEIEFIPECCECTYRIELLNYFTKNLSNQKKYTQHFFS